MSAPALLSLRDLRLRYGAGPEVLRGVSLDIAAGEALSLIGPSGAGKSALARAVLRLDAAGGLEYWVGFENFYVITRYNNSTYYAMTVHQLAQTLRQRRGLKQPTLRVTEQPKLAVSGSAG